MRADRDFYLGRLYPMQDRILARLASIETGFPHPPRGALPLDRTLAARLSLG